MKLLERLRNIFSRRSEIDATAYDAARPSDEFDSYWAYANGLDANAANSREVRWKLIHRSRYEKVSNGYSDGILNSLTNDMVGRVHAVNMLRMETGSEGFNNLVERRWKQWVKATGFSRTLWMQTHAKNQDGEGWGFVRFNPRVRHPVQLNVRLYEAEQITTPDLVFGDPNYVDGIRFDEFDNPVSYDLLRAHPGSLSDAGTAAFGDYDSIDARFGLHFAHCHRPGQKRGVVEHASTLNLGAAARRFRVANLSKAEKEAYWTLFLKTQFSPRKMQPVVPYSQMPLTHGMATALPNSVEPVQMRAEHPGPQYEAFNRLNVTEQGRPHSMPWGKSGGDWSDYNFASGRLAMLQYFDELDYQRYLIELQILEPLFSVWFDAAVLAYGWLGGDPDALGPQAAEHSWIWPRHRAADIQAEANANDKNLRNGSVSIPQLLTENGLDAEAEAEKAAQYFDIEVEEYKQLQLKAILGGGQAAADDGPNEPPPDPNDQTGSPGENVPMNAAARFSLPGSNGHAG